MNLKQKTVFGLTWSFIDQTANLTVGFVVGIILARLLSPEEFGLIGMITVFIAVSLAFVDSGFSQALIRKKNCTATDYSTVFYFNLVSGIICFFLLFFTSGSISNFFNEPKLKPIIQVLGFLLIIDALGLIQRTQLTKKINFKLQAKISLVSSFSSGIIAIIMAYKGFAVWSLVAQRLSRQTITTALLWILNRWKPIFKFSNSSFRQLFSFGSKLLVSGLIDTIYRNLYLVVIGRFFSAQDLGFYTRADSFKNLPSQNLNGIITRVTYPVLASIQDDIPRLSKTYKKIIRSSMFVTFILMLGMAAVAEPMIITLIGEKWRQSIIYLQMLSFVGVFYPLNAINLNMLKVRGRSDLFLRLEIIKKTLAFPVIFLGIFWGIKIMIIGMIINAIIAYYINSFWSGKMIGYSVIQQIKDILPGFLLALTMAIVLFVMGKILPFQPLLLLIIQLIAGAIFIFVFSEIIKLKDYQYLKSLVLESFLAKKKNEDEQNR